MINFEKKIMKNIILFICVLFLTACTKEDEIVSTSIEDVSGLSNFENKVSSGVSVMFFHATWCSKCKSQRPVVEKLKADIQFENVLFGQVDFEKNEAIIQKYEVLGFPTILMLKDGVVRERIEGPGHTITTLTSKLKPLL